MKAENMLLGGAAHAGSAQLAPFALARALLSDDFDETIPSYLVPAKDF
jgi:hypothetical protein